MTTEQIEFESWFSENYKRCIDRGLDQYRLHKFTAEPHQYIEPIPHHDFRVWQASRQVESNKN